jgi:hypothetical protein
MGNFCLGHIHFQVKLFFEKNSYFMHHNFCFSSRSKKFQSPHVQLSGVRATSLTISKQWMAYHVPGFSRSAQLRASTAGPDFLLFFIMSTAAAAAAPDICSVPASCTVGVCCAASGAGDVCFFAPRSCLCDLDAPVAPSPGV